MREVLLPPTPSNLFPRTLKTLFSLKSEDARLLLREYGIDESPSPKSPKPVAMKRAQSSSAAPATSPASSVDTLVEDGGSREQDINKFMAHIGVRAYYNCLVLAPIAIPSENLIL